MFICDVCVIFICDVFVFICDVFVAFMIDDDGGCIGLPSSSYEVKWERIRSVE